MTQMQNKICYELKIHVLEEYKELVAQILTQLDVGDFVYGQVDCDIEAEYDPSKVTEDLYEKLKQNPPFLLYSEDKEFLSSVQDALSMLFPKVNIPVQNNTFELAEFAEQNWRESWKQSFKPVLIKETFVLLPPWESPEEFSQKYKIIINPGMAFGTGQHETTRLCLEMMLQFPNFARFLDVGTGSGILAIAAKMLGAPFVLGNDIDPDCMPIAMENAKINRVENIYFSNQSIFELAEKDFDMVIANIQSQPLKILVPEILKRVTRNGVVILSGILVSEKEDFIQFLSQNHATIKETRDLNHWCAIVCQLS